MKDRMLNNWWVWCETIRLLQCTVWLNVSKTVWGVLEPQSWVWATDPKRVAFPCLFSLLPPSPLSLRPTVGGRYLLKSIDTTHTESYCFDSIPITFICKTSSCYWYSYPEEECKCQSDRRREGNFRGLYERITLNFVQTLSWELAFLRIRAETSVPHIIQRGCRIRLS